MLASYYTRTVLKSGPPAETQTSIGKEPTKDFGISIMNKFTSESTSHAYLELQSIYKTFLQFNILILKVSYPNNIVT